ncbi:choice-of-anchor G family protein, partial [Corynebacterium sp. A21]|uniref:choice-of-anchor G family protein n=1 Tax=Corynebacterium sp. A21 TaxID=3457318 RepID=UPI003FD627E1
MTSQPSALSKKLRRSIRLGIATITSTALVGGVLVAAPAHPLLSSTMVAEAAAQETGQELSRAEGLVLDLSLLRGFVAEEDLGILDGLITAIHAQQSFPENQGDGPVTSQLNLSALQAIDLNLGGITIPLVDDGSGRGLLDLGTEGAGVLSAYASAPSPGEAIASAGVINEDGSINADPSQEAGNVETNLQLTALLDQLGLGGITNGIADELALRLGAVSSMAQAQGAAVTSEYAVANAELYLHSPMVEQVGGLVEPGGLGANLDETVNALLGSEGVVGGQIIGLVSGLLEGLSIGSITLTANTNLEATLDTLLGQPLTSADELVTIDLQSGEVMVNLEKLHGENLSNLDPNTPLVNAEQLNQIVTTVDGLLESLSERITDTLNDGVLQTSLNIRISTPLGTTGIEGTLAEILAGQATTTNTGILGLLLTPLLEGLTAGLGGLLGQPDENGDLQVTILNSIISNLLTPVNSLLGAGAAVGLSDLIDNVLGEVAQVTLNYQPNELIAAAGTTAGRPNARTGSVTDLAQDFSVQPIRVELLGLGTDGGVVDLPVSRSTVTATADFQAPALMGLDPDRGPRAGGTEVTLSGTSLAYLDDEGSPTGIDTIYVNDYPITDFVLNPDDGTVTFQTPPWADLGTELDFVAVSVATNGVRSGSVGYTYFDDPTGPLADAHNPGYDWVMIKAGETLPVLQTGDDSIPAGSVFEIDPNWRRPAGWAFEIDPVTGELTVTAPDTAPPGMVFEIPVVVTYPDDSVDAENARINVIMSPFEIVQVIQGDEYTTIIFSDGSQVQVPNGTPGVDGETPEVGANGNWWIGDVDTGVPAAGADGQNGTSVTVVTNVTDPETGATTLTFSDGNVVVIPAGVSGVDGVDGASVTVTGSGLNADGDLEVTFSDGSMVTVPRGATGADGESITILSQTADANGNTVIEFSDGSLVTVAKGEAGQDGADGADGQTPSIGENGNWWIGDVDTNVPATGAAGADGESVSIVSIATDAAGNSTVTFSDGNVMIVPAGVSGVAGVDGTSVTVTDSALNADGDLEVTFSDGSMVTVPRGATGADGESITI